MRLRVNFTVGLSTDTFEQKDLGHLVQEVVEDALNEGGTAKARVNVSAINQALALPSVAAARFLALVTAPVDPTQTPTPLRFRLNTTTAEELVVQPIGTAAVGFLLLSTTGISALYVSNPSATVPMYATLVVLGD